ncbi:MAG: hypothetical protein PVF26_15620 [Desulfobacterales bacterium]|jgi:hypothetical protein
MRILKTYLVFLILLSAHINVANSSVSQLGLNRFVSEAKKTGMSSLDFRIDVIEQDGIPLDAVTITKRRIERPLVPVDNGGHLLLTSKNVFMTVTKGIVAMNLMAGNGTLISLVASSGNSIEFEPYSFTITPSVTNTKAVTALIEGVEFFIPPGESTRIVEINTMQNGRIDLLNRNSNGLIPIAILGSAYLDVSSIEIDSLLLQHLAVPVEVKSNEPAAIQHVNDDSYPDLIVKFEASKKYLNDDLSYTILNGQLTDGTIIKGITGPYIYH